MIYRFDNNNNTYMEKKDAIKLLGKKFVNIVSKLKVKKGAYNQFGSFYYHTLNDILENLKPLLEAEGCYIIFNNSIEYIQDRHYCISECRFYSFDIGDEVYISSKGYAREAFSRAKMDDAQITGSASTYAKKYALCSLFLIDDGSSDLDSLDNNYGNNSSNTNGNNNVKSENSLKTSSNIKSNEQEKPKENLGSIIDEYVKLYYKDKDYEKIIRHFSYLSENMNEDMKSVLRRIVRNLKTMDYNTIKNTDEYKKLLSYGN